MTEQEKQVTEYLREKLGDDLPSNLATYSINLPTVIRLIEDFANQSNTKDWEKTREDFKDFINEQQVSGFVNTWEVIFDWIKTYFQSTPQKELKDELIKYQKWCYQHSEYDQMCETTKVEKYLKNQQ